MTISDTTNTFEYLKGRLKTNDNVTVAQFPREVEISLDLAVLQKERAVTGAANFGHAPRDINNQAVIAGGNNPFSTNLLVPIKSFE